MQFMFNLVLIGGLLFLAAGLIVALAKALLSALVLAGALWLIWRALCALWG